MAFGNFSSALACKRNLSCNITSHSTDIFAKNITTSIDFSFHRFVKFVRKTIIVQKSLGKSRKERVKRECGLYCLKPKFTNMISLLFLSHKSQRYLKFIKLKQTDRWVWKLRTGPKNNPRNYALERATKLTTTLQLSDNLFYKELKETKDHFVNSAWLFCTFS